MRRLLSAAALAGLSLLSLPASAGLLGQSIQIRWYFPDSSTLFDTSGPVTVTGGVEWTPGSGVGDIDVSDLGLTITNTTAGWAGASFNGFTFQNLGTGVFTSFSLLNPGTLRVDPLLTFNSSLLSVNFTPDGGGNFDESQPQTYRFAFTMRDNQPVPEPASLALLGLALGGLALARRRR